MRLSPQIKLMASGGNDDVLTRAAACGLPDDPALVAPSSPIPAHDKAGRGWLSDQPWMAVVLLMIIGIINYLDRALPAILAEPIKQDLGLSDTAIGLINGIGFLAVYLVATIPLAKLADHGHYKSTLVWSLGLWSAMTSLGGMAMSVWQFALTRMGVALGEAGGTPAAHAYIVRNIPATQRTTALTIFGLSSPLGAMAGLVLGGVVGHMIGWRNTLLLMGGIGLVLAVLTRLCLGRGDAGAIERVPAAARVPLATLLRKRAVCAIMVGTSFMGMAGYAEIVFSPAFLMRSHGMSLKEAGLAFGLLGGIAATFGLIILAWATNFMSRRDPRWLVGTMIVAIVIGLPLSYLSFTTANTTLALAGLAVNHTLVAIYSIPMYAALHRLSKLELRAQASGLQLLAASLLGGLGPVITGRISDHLTPEFGDGALGKALLLTVPGGLLVAAVAYSLALIWFRREMEPE